MIMLMAVSLRSILKDMIETMAAVKVASVDKQTMAELIMIMAADQMMPTGLITTVELEETMIITDEITSHRGREIITVALTDSGQKQITLATGPVMEE
jgi:hypothetical protein